MNNPTREQVQVVIDNPMSVLPMAQYEKNLDMLEGDICGTTLCHGGWYAISIWRDNIKGRHFADGARRMAWDLGFDDRESLETWAKKHAILGWRYWPVCVLRRYGILFPNPARRSKKAIRHN